MTVMALPTPVVATVIGEDDRCLGLAAWAAGTATTDVAASMAAAVMPVMVVLALFNIILSPAAAGRPPMVVAPLTNVGDGYKFSDFTEKL